MHTAVLSRATQHLLCAALLLVAAPSWAQPIVIGRTLALSGPLKAYGDAKREGGDACIEKINKGGGVGGKQIKLVTLDDQYQPPQAVANLKQLATEQKPTAFLGLFGVPTVAAMLPVLPELKIPAVGITSGTAAVRSPYNPYVFPVRASYADEARKLVSQVQTMSIQRVAVIYTNNPFGESVKNTLVEALKKAGLTSTEFKLDVAGKDAAAVVAKVAAGNPQGVFLTMLSQPAVPAIRELKKTNASSLVYTFSPVDTTVVLKELGASAGGLSITQVVPIPTSSQSRLASEYVQALKELGRGSPSFYGLEAFLEAKVLVEGLRRAGSASANSAALMKALETMTDWDAGGMFVSYKPGNHQGASYVDIDIVDSSGTLRR